MNTEDRLRAAFEARAEQLTEPKLDELAARHPTARHQAGVEDMAALDRGVHTVTLEPLDFEQDHHPRHRRWIAPVLAAAAVAVVAVGVAAVARTALHTDPPAIAPTTPGVSAPKTTPSPSSTAPPTASHSGDTGPYLGPGQTGARTAVPWTLVEAGWRLVQPGSQAGPGSSLYLYDPADGRYLISDQLAAKATVVGWSPDGIHAALQLPDRLDQIDLRSGKISTIVQGSTFVTYTRPHGLAVLVSSATDLRRFGTDGSLQLRYSNDMNGIGSLVRGPNSIFYTDDGAAFVATGVDRAVLISNAGAPLRAYDLPAGMTTCHPMRAWDSGVFLEYCLSSQHRFALYLQPIAISGAAQPLISRTDLSYADAWRLSNGDTLIALAGQNCKAGGYLVLHADGSLSALRVPSGVPNPGYILNVSGDVATFTLSPDACQADQYGTVDYNMVTGVTTSLSSGGGAPTVNYPTS